jgi:hypothetical protein
MTMTRDRSCHTNPLATQKIYVEGNMETIFEMIPINISRTPGKIDNVFIKSYSSPEEMSGINPQTVYQELNFLFFKLTMRSESNIRETTFMLFNLIQIN